MYNRIADYGLRTGFKENYRQVIRIFDFSSLASDSRKLQSGALKTLKCYSDILPDGRMENTEIRNPETEPEQQPG